MGWKPPVVERSLDQVTVWLPTLPHLRRVASMAVGLALLLGAGTAAIQAARIDPEAMERVEVLADALVGIEMALETRPDDVALLNRHDQLMGSLTAASEEVSHPLAVPAAGAAGGLLGALLGTGGGLLLWWMAPGVRLRLARHWVELDGHRVELADLTGLAVVDGRVEMCAWGRPPIRSAPLLDAEDAGYHLDAAREVMGSGERESEESARDAVRQALDGVRSAVPEASRA